MRIEIAVTMKNQSDSDAGKWFGRSFGVLLCLWLAAGCGTPAASNCATDDDCDGSEICVSGGGLIVSTGGRCVSGATFVADTGGRCDGGAAGCGATDTDVGAVDTDDRRADAEDATAVAQDTSTEDTTADTEDTTAATDGGTEGDADTPKPCTDGDRKSCYTGPSGTAGEGICSEGSQTCENGSWTACRGEGLPKGREMCGNGKDDDCDGVVDNGCPCVYDPDEPDNIDTDGSHETGVCTGQTIGAFGCEKPVSPSYAGAETGVCDDGVDNDCDGETDEASKQPGDYCDDSCECSDGDCVAVDHIVTVCEHCSDGIKNGNEADVDCGRGLHCPRCKAGSDCNLGRECLSGSCTDGTCDAQ